MAKSKDTKKEVKKEPAKTPKEKKAEKREKKEKSKQQFISKQEAIIQKYGCFFFCKTGKIINPTCNDQTLIH